MTAPITTMIFTLNEEANLPACLESLQWCDDVIVIDSFSSDRTEEISRAAGARFYQNPFEGFGTQRNWALDHTDPKHPWILVLDADERVPDALAEEMERAVKAADDSVSAYRVRRRFHMWGRWLRHSSLYPTWVVRLFRADRMRYENRGHAETQEVDGEIRALNEDLIDENLKGIVEWFERQARYARKEAEFELENAFDRAQVARFLDGDPLERRNALKRFASTLPGRAGAYFLYAYLFRGGYKDGVDGFMFCVMRAMYQQMIVAAKHELRRTESAGRRSGNDGGP